MAHAQQAVDPRMQYERLIAVVPLTGVGTAEDPRRPLFVPKPGEASGIVAFVSLPSDDGLSAIVEFVARTREALDPIRQHGRADVAVYERVSRPRKDVVALPAAVTGNRAAPPVTQPVATPEAAPDARSKEVNQALQRVRRDFRLDSFGVVLP